MKLLSTLFSLLVSAIQVLNKEKSDKFNLEASLLLVRKVVLFSSLGLGMVLLASSGVIIMVMNGSMLLDNLVPLGLPTAPFYGGLALLLFGLFGAAIGLNRRFWTPELISARTESSKSTSSALEDAIALLVTDVVLERQVNRKQRQAAETDIFDKGQSTTPTSAESENADSNEQWKQAAKVSLA